MEKYWAIDVFENESFERTDAHWYVIADSAQHPDLPDVLGRPARCLLNASQGSPLAAKSPHLVEMCAPTGVDAGWQWIDRFGGKKPCVSVIASSLDFDAVFERLEACTQIKLPDGDEMFFAFWDPAILGPLMGQADDLTLHVAGPVFSASERNYFANTMEAWWYWDRSGALHSIQFDPNSADAKQAPFHLDQRQVDDLVEASIPDHILYFIDLNQPHLLARFNEGEGYEFVRGALQGARSIGLEAMRDLVNYVCVALIYDERMSTDPVIAALLSQVQTGALNFEQAMELFS